VIRPAEPGDFPAILALDEEWVHFASPLDEGALADLDAQAAYHRVADHDKIDRLAIVGDKRWQHLLASLAHPSYARDSRYIHTAERAVARDRLGSE
jgi:crotonobetainyl-CoA:carnitine CoA-transferase CaiB-like acyl-CoA transferase